MFGMSLGEMLVLGVVAIVVVGPRNLPSMLRNAGQLIGRLRKMAADIRAESGIDEILEVEGIRSEIDHFRKLATGQIDPDEPLVVPDREREYPRIGPDVFGAESEDVDPYLASVGGLASEPAATPGADVAPEATSSTSSMSSASHPATSAATDESTAAASAAPTASAPAPATAPEGATASPTDDEVKANSR